MKRWLMIVAAACASASFQFFAVSCGSGLDVGGEGELRLSFDSAMANEVRSVTDIPDTSDFLLTVANSAGSLIYDGKYGDCPESMKVSAGNYTVTVKSAKFLKPAFDAPQYGDSQCIVVEKDGIVNVSLVCRQLNSGVKLSISPAFLTAYPDGVLFLKSSEGKLMYSYSEKRIAYFNPGPVSLMLSSSGVDELLMTRELESQEILVLGVGVSGNSASSQGRGICVAVDTTRNWTAETFVIGSGSGGASQGASVTVAQARTMAPASDVWVSGYIVGGDLTSSSGAFDTPFKSKTNLILGPRSTTVDRDVCIAVQLQSGSLRDKLNLVDNPSLLGKKVSLRGDLVTDYFNLVGLKNLKEVEL